MLARSFYFIRHGETDYNAQNILMGQLDIDLNKCGKLQAKQVREILSKEQIDLIFHSFLKRTCQTAKIISQNKIKIYKLQGIEERNCGSFQGLSKDHIKQLRMKAERYFFPEDAETNIEFENRVFSAFDNALKLNPEKNILFVSHGGVFKTLLKILNLESFEIKNCQVIGFTAPNSDQDSWIVKLVK